MKRILSLDGGGIKGAFAASFLATVEDSIGGSLASYFDLMVGTSTGGIIALALGLGLTARQILSFYEQKGPKIFGGSRLVRAIRHIGISKYSQKPLREALESNFGDRKLGESTNRLVIPSFNLENGDVHIYKTAHHPRFERDYLVRAVDVALATAAAPTFFPTHKTTAGTPLMDGGIWANNPVGIAVVEAIGVLNWPKESLKVLSLGATSEPFDVGIRRHFPFGWGYWAFKIPTLFMTAQSSAALGMAQVIVGHENIQRISPIVPPGRFGLDVAREIPSLRGLGETEARKALPQLRSTFFESPAEPFTSYRAIG